MPAALFTFPWTVSDHSGRSEQPAHCVPLRACKTVSFRNRGMVIGRGRPWDGGLEDKGLNRSLHKAWVLSPIPHLHLGWASVHCHPPLPSEEEAE